MEAVVLLVAASAAVGAQFARRRFAFRGRRFNADRARIDGAAGLRRSVVVFANHARGGGDARFRAAAGFVTDGFAFCAPFAPPVALAQKGIAATTIEDIRWRRADIKSVSLLGAVMAAAAAKERGAAEAILLRDGFLREGASSNVFVVCAGAGGGEIATPIADHSILAGITREIVIDSARRLGYAVRERAIAREELTAAAEMWICSSTREILPSSNGTETPSATAVRARRFAPFTRIFRRAKNRFAKIDPGLRARRRRRLNPMRRRSHDFGGEAHRGFGRRGQFDSALFDGGGRVRGFVDFHLLDDGARFFVVGRQLRKMAAQVRADLPLRFGDESQRDFVRQNRRRRADGERAAKPQRIEKTEPPAQLLDFAPPSTTNDRFPPRRLRAWRRAFADRGRKPPAPDTAPARRPRLRD